MNLLLLAIGYLSLFGGESAPGAAPASDTGRSLYFVAPASSLSWTDGGSLGAHAELVEWRGGSTRPYLGPYAVLEGAGEVYLVPPSDTFNESFAVDVHSARIAVRLPAGGAARGKLFTPEESGADSVFFGEPGFALERAPAFQALGFEIRPDQCTATREEFLRARLTHDERLLRLNAPGSAWWRMRIDDTKRELGPPEATNAIIDGRTLMGNRWTRTDVDDTFELFTGGRALSENLQLDRMILPGPGGVAEIELASLPGIETASYDWKASVEGKHPELDPLSESIPEDQHAIFFPSFDAFLSVIEECERQGNQWYQIAEPSSEDQAVRRRYERQMCLPLNAVTKTLGPLAIQSLALTGSDPFLRTGTDLAVVFQSSTPKILFDYLVAQQQSALAQIEQAATGVQAQAFQGAFSLADGTEPVAWQAVVSTDASVRAYLAQSKGMITVSNSLAQLERVVRAAHKELPSLARSDEYKFFRDRYPRGTGESAFVLLTDATIRRWCSPRWRIGMARRTQVAAWLADLEARRLACLANAKEVTRENLGHTGLDNFEFVGNGRSIHSKVWGSTRFMRPILELDLNRVTTAERDAYERYRVRYQSRWAQFFDPIALRLDVSPDGFQGDLTVMPLIAGTEYRDLREWCGESTLQGLSYKPENAIGHFAMTLDPEGRHLKEFGSMLSSMGGQAGSVSTGWIDGRVELYAHEDAFWTEYAEAEAAGNDEQFIGENFHRLPIVVAVPSKDPLRMATLLTAMRTASASAAPGLLTWTTLEHQGQPYVCIRPVKGAGGGFIDLDEVQICYAALPSVWLVTFREDLLKQALERVAANAQKGAEGSAQSTWFAGSACLEFSPRLPLFLYGFGEDGFLETALASTWAALPILNELQRAFPGQDAQQIYAESFGAGTLGSGQGGGAGFAWNEKWSSFESTLYGLPAAPRQGPTMKSLLAQIERLALGITFEQDGLRAKARLQRVRR